MIIALVGMPPDAEKRKSIATSLDYWRNRRWAPFAGNATPLDTLQTMMTKQAYQKLYRALTAMSTMVDIAYSPQPLPSEIEAFKAAAGDMRSAFCSLGDLSLASFFPFNLTLQLCPRRLAQAPLGHFDGRNTKQCK